MSTHRVTLELPIEAYENLRRMVEEGEYSTESDAVADAFIQKLPSATSSAPFDRWMREEVLVADDELEADPSSGVLPEQLHEMLAAARVERAYTRS